MPSTIQAQLVDDMKNAMRAHESLKLNTIRFMMSAIKNWQIDNRDKVVDDKVDDKDAQSVIAKEVKKIIDANAEFKAAGRMDLVEEEEKKLEIMRAYLPKQMSDEDLEAKVKEVIAGLPDKNMGMAMKAVMAAVGGQADGGKVSALVKQHLNA